MLIPQVSITQEGSNNRRWIVTCLEYGTQVKLFIKLGVIGFKNLLVQFGDDSETYVTTLFECMPPAHILLSSETDSRVQQYY